MIHSESEASGLGRRPKAQALLALVAAAVLPALAACSSAAHRSDLAGHVLDEQTVMLQSLKVERADRRVSTKVQTDPDLKAAEEHLNMAIEMLKRSNGAVKAAL